MQRRQRIVILGSTGSIGTQTLEVIEHLRRTGAADFEVAGLAAGRCSGTLDDQARRHRARVATAEPGRVPSARSHDTGRDAAADLVARCHDEAPVDMVVASIVGVAGLAPVLAALERGIDVALANKETLVAAGELMVAAARAGGAALLPVDSEHSGIWQCLRGAARTAACMPPIERPDGLERITLTASGGALRAWAARRIADATPAQALAHPTWQMGQKVTIDSATLMNKGFEVMEARWLFGLDPGRIGVLVQPTSTVHAIAEFDDGTLLAQLGTPDMRTAIQYAMLRGVHTAAPDPGRLDLAALGSLEFHEPDPDRFPMLGFAYDALRTGGNAGAALNAANEAAVAVFLDPANADGARMRLGRIPELVQQAIESIPVGPADSLDAVLSTDAEARDRVHTLLGLPSSA
ncbi:MAG: 1-deoxy-D-xylulose-5-phosphate reductoisomerase [Phycisphaerales bacterium]